MTADQVPGAFVTFAWVVGIAGVVFAIRQGGDR